MNTTNLEVVFLRRHGKMFGKNHELYQRFFK